MTLLARLVTEPLYYRSYWCSVLVVGVARYKTLECSYIVQTHYTNTHQCISSYDG